MSPAVVASRRLPRLPMLVELREVASPEVVPLLQRVAEPPPEFVPRPDVREPVAQPPRSPPDAAPTWAPCETPLEQVELRGLEPLTPTLPGRHDRVQGGSPQFHKRCDQRINTAAYDYK